jgi:hypothetical protein
MEEVDVEVMQVDKATKLFRPWQLSLNRGYLNLEVSSLKNRLATREKEKVVVQVELDKDFHKEYRHNIEIWGKNMAKNEQKIKTFIHKMQDENKELKVSTKLMKSQVEEL